MGPTVKTRLASFLLPPFARIRAGTLPSSKCTRINAILNSWFEFVVFLSSNNERHFLGRLANAETLLMIYEETKLCMQCILSLKFVFWFSRLNFSYLDIEGKTFKWAKAFRQAPAIVKLHFDNVLCINFILKLEKKLPEWQEARTKKMFDKVVCRLSQVFHNVFPCS